MTDKAPAGNSVNKALDILEDLSEHGPSALAELHQRLGLDKGTLHRLLKLLKQRDFVDQDRSDRRYFNTTKMFQLGGREIERGGLRVLARPSLEQLAATFREVVHVAIMGAQDRPICVDKIEAAPSFQARLNLNLGSEVSLYASSLGKCLLAFADEEVRARILPKIKYERFTSSTIRGAVAFKKELDRVRALGYAFDDGETLESIFCVGAPILDHQGRSYAAISVTGPKTRMLDKKDQVIKTLKSMSRDLSIRYGLPAGQWPIKED